MKLKIESKINLIKIVFCFGLFFIFTLIETIDYFEYKGKVMEVQATVVDSVNYTEKSKAPKSKDIYYKSLMNCHWCVEGKDYEQQIIKSGTYLQGDELTIYVLKDNPAIVKDISKSLVIGLWIFDIFICLLVIASYVWDYMVEKLDSIKALKNSKEKPLYIDVVKEKKKESSLKRKRFALEITIAVIFFIGGIIVLISSGLSYYYDNSRDSIEVECRVVKADNYLINSREYAGIVGQWEIDGQVYKKVLPALDGKYLEGEVFTTKVLEDTPNSKGIDTQIKITDSFYIVFLVLISALFIIFTVKRWRKEKAKFSNYFPIGSNED